MNDLPITKLEAARRLIDVGIKLLFSDEDPLAIHTLAAGAFRVVRDLANKTSGHILNTRLKDVIAPGKEREFWKAFNTTYNFLKHAESDSEDTLDGFDGEANDHILFIDCQYYAGLGQSFTPEMNVLSAWYMAMYPEMIITDSNSPLRQMHDLNKHLSRLTRKQQLQEGRKLLRFVRNNPSMYGNGKS